MVDRSDIGATRRALGAQLAAARKNAGLIQQQLADLTMYSRSTVGNAETGRQNVPRSFWIRCDELLETGTALVGGYDEVQHLIRSFRTGVVLATETERRARMRFPVSVFPVSMVPDDNDRDQRRTDTSEDVIDVLRRVYRRSGALDPHVVGGLADNFRDVVADYEHKDPAALRMMLVKQRQWIDTLLDECSQVLLRRTLFNVAAGTAGVLAYIAVGRGSFSLARAYCTEAFQLGDLAEDRNLQAWARGLHSFCEYYAGRYHEALQLALDGLRYAPAGPQSVRLTINGVARALGKLGDVDGVHKAVADAYDLLSHNNPPAGLPSSITLGCYSAAQTASNAATAYVSLGKPAEVAHYVGMALPDIIASQSPWSQSLTMIDLAASVLTGQAADVEHASQLALAALNISAGRPIISVHQRTLDLINNATNRWGRTAHIDAVRDALYTTAIC